MVVRESDEQRSDAPWAQLEVMILFAQDQALRRLRKLSDLHVTEIVFRCITLAELADEVWSSKLTPGTIRIGDADLKDDPGISLADAMTPGDRVLGVNIGQQTRRVLDVIRARRGWVSDDPAAIWALAAGLPMLTALISGKPVIAVGELFGELRIGLPQ